MYLTNLIADKYYKNLQEVSTGLIDLESVIHAREFSKGRCSLSTNYFLLASAYLIKEYEGVKK